MPADKKPAEATAYLLLTLTALSWSANVIFGQLAVGEVSPMVLVALRWLGALMLLLIFANGAVRRDWPVLRRHIGFISAMGALGFALFNALFYVASHTTSAINIGIIQGSMPVLILLGAYAAHRTRVTKVQFVGVISTLLGVAIVATGGDPFGIAALSFKRGDLLMMAACAIYAGYAVMLARRPEVSALGFFTVLCGAAFAMSLPLVAVEAAMGLLQWPTPRGWIVVGLATLLPSLLAQICFIRGVALIGPGRAGVFVNLVPIFAAVFAVTLLDERFEAHHAMALVLVLGGIYLSERGKAA